MTKRAAYLTPALAALLLLSACGLFEKAPTGPTQTTTVVVTTTQQPAPGPSSSPAPSSCDLGKLLPGAEDDARDIARGATVGIGVTLLGTQGIELPSSCLGDYTPTWSGGAPCQLIGSSGYDVALFAPSTAPLDAVCEAKVTVDGKTGLVSLKVKG